MQKINKLHSAYNTHGIAYIFGRGVEEVLTRSPIAKRLYWKFAPYYFHHKYKQKDNFSSPLNILKLTYVDPRKITNFSGRDFTTGTERKSNIGKVMSGEWDKHSSRKLTAEYIYRSIKKRFEKKCSWRETELYEIESERIKETGQGIWHDCSSLEELEKRFTEVDNLFYDIKNNGYEPTFCRRYEENRTFLNCLLNEITIDLGRDGELLFVDGRHRLVIAKTLSLDKIPVFVLVRHKKWMETRDAAYKGESRKEHPDMCEFQTEDTYSRNT